MSSKRPASSELNHDNWDNEEPASDEGIGQFKAASKDVLQTRVMRTAKRRAHLTTGGNVKKSVFSAFGGFNKAQPQSFDFLSKLTNGNTTEADKSDAVPTSTTFTSQPQAGLFGATNINSGIFGNTLEPATQSPFGIPTAQNSKPQTPFGVTNTSSGVLNKPVSSETAAQSPFGSPVLQSNTSQTGLFGATNINSNMFEKPVPPGPSTQSPFGTPANQNSQPQTGLFGATNINSGMFDKPVSTESATQSTFGIQTPQNSKPQTGLFGATNVNSGMFEKPITAEPATQSTFGSPITQNNKSQTGLFGATNVNSGMFEKPISAEPATQSTFGTPITQNNKSQTGLFGATNVNSGVFDKPVSADPSTQNLFGTPTTQSNTGLFGSTNIGTGLFGKPVSSGPPSQPTFGTQPAVLTSTTPAAKPLFATSSPVSSLSNNPFNIQTVDSSKNISFNATNASVSSKLFSSSTTTNQSTFNSKPNATTSASVFGTVSTTSNASTFKTDNANSTTQPFKTIGSSKTTISNSTNIFGSPAITSVKSDQELRTEQSRNSLKTKSDDKTGTGKKKDKEAIYHNKLSSLNRQVAKWIATNVEETPISILTPIFRDYERYLVEIQSEYLGIEKKDTSSKAESESKISSNISENHNLPKTNDTTINSKLNSDVQVNKTDTVKIPETNTSVFGSIAPILQAPSFGIQPTMNVSSASNVGASCSFSAKTNTAASNAPSSTFSFGSKTTTSNSAPSSGFSFGSNTTTSNSAPFSFGNGKPFSFNANIQKPAETTNEGKEEEDEEPPKVEFTQLVEENSVFDKRCKLFFKSGSNFIDKGLATLYIKKIEESDKHQLLIRANTNIGKVLVNLILSSSIPTQRMGKNNVMLVCIPTPESKPPPTPLLIRVKTSEEADQLLETLNKYKC